MNTFKSFGTVGPVKVVIPGGTGHLGRVLSRAFAERGDEVVVLTRRDTAPEPGVRHVRWNARAAGPWTAELDGSDVVLNLAGRSVHCRYTRANLREMWTSRIDSARVVGGAIERAARPPRVWLQMSTATIYAHRFDAPNDEATGVLGGGEPGVPATGPTASTSPGRGSASRRRRTPRARARSRCGRRW